MVYSPRLSECLEAVCNCGCTTVRATISTLEAGLPAACTESLDEAERQAFLQELKAIMAAYDC